MYVMYGKCRYTTVRYMHTVLTGNFTGESALEGIKSCCIQHTSSFPAHNLSQCHSKQQPSSVYNDDSRLGRSDMPVKLGYDV